MFRRHEARRTKHQAGFCLARIGDPGNAEVRNFYRIAVNFVHDIGGLDVPVHHVLFVCISQRLSNTRHDGQHFWSRQQIAIFAEIQQILAFEEFHGDIRQVVFFAGIEDSDDILMLQSPCRFSFAEEPFARIDQLITGKLLAQSHRLDRHNPANFRVFTKVNHTHRTLAKLLVNLITAKHRLLHRAPVEQHGPAWMRATATQHHRFGKILRPVQLRLQVFVVLIVGRHMLVYGLGFIELAFTFKVQRQVV